MPLSTSTKVATGVASAALAGLLVIGGASLASAAGESTPSTGSTSEQSGGRAPHEHTPVTGDEASKVTAAVTAEDAAVTVTTVQKDPDGSYDVEGTKAGAPVRFDVSADPATVTERTGRGGRDGGGGGGRESQDTPVTGDEASRVSAAVTAKDSAVTVSEVRKDPDGSYDVEGTKAGARVHYDVSADLATITERTGRGGPGGAGGHGGRDHGSADETEGSGSAPGSSGSSSPSDAQPSSYSTTSA